MANPQKEHGHLEIANELVEVLMKSDFSGGEFRLIFAILRKTWGWQKKEDWISLSQLAKLTGFTKSYVCRIKRQLVNNRTLLERENKLRFNKNYEEWLVNNRTLATDRTLGVVNNRTTGSVQTDNKASVQSYTHNRQRTKDINTKESQPILKNSLADVRKQLEDKGIVRRNSNAVRLDTGPVPIKKILTQ